MEKVKLTREQDKAIKDILSYATKENILKEHKQGHWTVVKYRSLNDIDFDTMAKALYNDYEVERTPEEKLIVSYADCVAKVKIAEKYRRYGDLEYFKGKSTGIKETLHALGVTVQGINE